MVEMAFALLIITLAGYAIGRTIGAEEIFSDFRAWVEDGSYKKIKDINGDEHYPYPVQGGSVERDGKSWFYAHLESTTVYPIDLLDAIENEETGEFEEIVEVGYAISSPNFYRPGFLGFLRGKLGDLFTCAICMTGQSCLWLGIAYLVFGFGLVQYLVPLAAIGAGYMILAVVARLTK